MMLAFVLWMLSMQQGPTTGTLTVSNLESTFVALDVPAIQEDYISHTKGEMFVCEDGQNMCGASEDIDAKRWTCADKSRILLRDESGNRHCIKFLK